MTMNVERFKSHKHSTRPTMLYLWSQMTFTTKYTSFTHSFPPKGKKKPRCLEHFVFILSGKLSHFSFKDEIIAAIHDNEVFVKFEWFFCFCFNDERLELYFLSWLQIILISNHFSCVFSFCRFQKNIVKIPDWRKMNSDATSTLFQSTELILTHLQSYISESLLSTPSSTVKSNVQTPDLGHV